MNVNGRQMGGVWFTRLCVYVCIYIAACWCQVKLVCTSPQQGNSPEHCFAGITHDGEKICVDQTHGHTSLTTRPVVITLLQFLQGVRYSN